MSSLARRLLCALAPLTLATAFAAAPAAQAGTLPFSPTSVFNQRLADDAPLDPYSAPIVGELVRQVGAYGTWVNTTQYTTPIYKVSGDVKRVKVILDNPNLLLQQQFDSVPVPTNAQPSAGTDGDMTIWQASTDTAWEFWQMHKASDGHWHASWGGRMSNVSTSSGIFPNPFGVAATGLSLMGGIIRPDEITGGNINHALSISVPEATKWQFRWPANRTDGTILSGGIPEGTRFRLPANIDIRSLGLPWAAGLIAQAAQRYGLIVDDKGGAVGFYGEDPKSIGSNPWPALFENRMPNTMLAKFPWDKLEVVAVPTGR